MSNNNENKMVPELRFPEFTNDKWAEVLLSKLGETINGLAGKSGKDFGTGKPYVTYKQVFDSSKVDFSKCSLVEIAENENQNTLSKGDILFTASSETPHEVGIASVVLTEPNEPTYLNSFCFAFRPFSLEQLQPAFSQFLFHSPAYRKSIEVLAQGITRFNISKKAFLRLKVPLPKNPAEQQKIAACLSSLDELITAESKKLELLKEHKKGLLQNLFPQEGETVPKLRFKEFEDSGEWEADIIKNVFSIFQGFAFSSNDSVPKGVRWLKIADVGIQQMNHLSPSYLPIEFKEKYKNFLVKEGDYVIALTRPILNKKLKISKVDNILNESLLNQRVGKLVSNICIDFVYYLLQTSKLISTIEQNIAGSEPPNLSSQQIENIEVFIPTKIKEQEKIAETLSSIDDLIMARNQKIEALQLHKKGLLQGLFPNINEVTV